MTDSLAIADTDGSSRFYRIALWGFAAAALVVGMFFSTARELAGIWWRSETFAHGLVVVPISAWLLWDRRNRLIPLSMQPAWLALVPLVLAAFGWTVGEAASVAALSHFSLVAMIISAIWCVWGSALARAALFPLCFLFFGVPFGEFLVPALMQHTADFTVAALRFSGIPVYREGLQFVIPSGHWSVVEACSGIRYLIASTMVGVLFAHLNYQSTRRRTLFVVAALVVPLVANWMRAYLIVMLGHLSGNRLATGVDHLIYGWVFFGIVIMALFWVGSFWREADPHHGVAEGSVAAQGRLAVDAPVYRACLALALVAAGAGIWKPVLTWLVDVPGAPQYSIAAPAAAPGWEIVSETPVAGFVPHYTGERARRLVTYRHDGHELTLFLAFYARQSPGHELVQWDNRLLFREDKIWSELEQQTDSLADGIATRRSLIRNASGQLVLAWNWNWLDDRHTADDRAAKLALAADRLARRPDDSAAIVVWTESGEATENARALAQAFVSAHLPAIVASLHSAPRH